MDPGREGDGTAEPPILLPYLAYFFLPLPEPIGLPHGWVLRVHEPSPGQWWRREDGGVPPAVHTAGSLLFHRAEAPGPERDRLGVVFDVAAAALPHLDRPPRPPGPGPGGPPTELTVVEMAVGFDPGPDGDADTAAVEGPFFDAISDAFDRGLAWVREVQRAYYTVRRLPVRLAAREASPFAVPFGVRRLWDDDGEPLPFQVPLSLYLLNSNLTARDANLDDAEEATLRTALREQADGGPFTSYLDFRREASVALWRDGGYRAAVLFTATACEVLLDELLAHMLWQEGARPEEAAPVFGPYLATRVKTQYHRRLGGTWAVDAPGPVRDWSVDVAALRNRVVHAGHEPTIEQARAAAEATEALQDHLGDLLATRTAAYPRTALVLPGEHGLRRRGRWSRRLEAIRDDPDQVPWTATYARWRLAMQRARTDSPLASVPSAADAWVLLVVRPGGAVQWVVHDRIAGFAAPIGRDRVSGVSHGQQEQLDRLVEGWREGLCEAVSVHVAGASAAEPAPDAWVLEYRLVPLAGVMVHGRDLDPL